MRNPFKIKNGIDPEYREVGESEESLTFEESLADSTSHGILEREGEHRFHIGIFVSLLLLSFVLVTGRLYYLTISQHEYFLEIAQGNRLRVEYLPAPRGAVYDAYGEVLAGNKPSFELVASPLDLPADPQEREEEVKKVAEILAMPAEEIKNLISNQQIQVYQSALVKQNLSREQALIFHERARGLPGFRVVNTPLRDYKNPLAFAHILGYVGKINPEEYKERAAAGYLFNDFLGKTGLEQIYENYLRGVFGQRQVEVDSRGVVKKIFGEKDSQPGKNIYLNIDAALQEKLYDSLSRRISGIGRKKAAAVVLDPRNGKVLAFLSLPSFDNNLFAEGIDPQVYQKITSDPNKPLFNRAIQGTYPPGSTVKPMVAAAALQEQVINPSTLVADQGQIVIKNPYGGPDYYFYGYARKALGILDVRRAIALSSDIFFYIMGGGYESAKIDGLGIDRLAKYFSAFNLGAELGIDLPGEATGLVPTPEWKNQRFAGDSLASRWYLGDTYHVSIGQGDLLVTPLQMVSWTEAIANGGKIFRPRLVDRIVDNSGKVVQQFVSETVGQVPVSDSYLQIVREGMRKAVLEGTAKSFQSLPVSVAAKTGTAQFDAKNPNRSHAWFTAFAPYEDPQIAVTVLVEDGGEGSINAAPVAKEVLEWWAKNRYRK